MTTTQTLDSYEVPVARFGWSALPVHVHGEWSTDVAPSGAVRYACGGCGYRPPVGTKASQVAQAPASA